MPDTKLTAINELTTLTTTTMRQGLFGIISALVLLNFSSCCSTKDCLGFSFDNQYHITLYNFEHSDVDSIALETFEGQSNFATRIDTFLMIQYIDPDQPAVSLAVPYGYNLSHDYKITLIGTGQVYSLADLKTKEEECNCPSAKYEVLESYYLNGQKVYAPIMTITQ